MKLKKELFIHSHIFFDETEKDVLASAYKIVSNLRYENIYSCGTEDSYLNELCSDILDGISELLDNYTNEYLEKG